MKRVLSLAVFGLLTAIVVNSQTATVKRNVNVRPAASTDNSPIELLTPPTSLTLIESGVLEANL
jgi:hypothetical protein